jgi:hypothetical protein
MKLNVLFILSVSFVFTACSPKIGTSITKTYPALNQSEPVVLFTNPASVPANGESLGIARITDSGFTVRCDLAVWLS